MQLKTSSVFLLKKISGIYHFGVKVFNILGVENSHESLCAYSLAAVFLPHHQCYVLWVVLEVVDE